MDIKTAKTMRTGIDIEAILKSKNNSRTVNLKQGGTVEVWDTTIHDDSGEMKLTLWGEDGNGVKVGDVIKITNGYTNTFKDEVSLTKGKYGQMEINP